MLIGLTILLVPLLLAVRLRPAFSLDASAGASPAASMRALIDDALAVLRNSHLPLDEKRRQLHALARGKFDLADMARAAMGDHWGALSAEQRAAYTDAFSAFIEEAYLNKIQDYSGQDIELTAERMEGPNLAEVDSVVVKSGEEPIKLDFLLRRNGASWQIYDFNVDGISTVGNYRVQFAREIDKYGFAQLMAVLRQKQQRLAALLGQK